jgi:prephenate dehydrogenase
VIVLTPARGKRWLPLVKKVFAATGAKLKIASPEEHDRMMAVVQGLMHFSSVALVSALRSLGVNIKDLNSYSSPVYRIRMDFAERILNQDAELYADIALSNPRTKEVISAYIKSSRSLLSAIEGNKRSSFITAFKTAAAYLGGSKKSAEKRTDHIISFMSGL